MEQSTRLAVGLALLALPLPIALAVQPLRHWRSLVGRAVLLLLAPLAMAGQSVLVPEVGGALMAPATGLTAKLVLLVVLHTVLALPAALLAAILLARPEPPGLRLALVGVGVPPTARFLRLTMPELLPGLLLGWLAGMAPALAVMTLFWRPLQ